MRLFIAVDVKVDVKTSQNKEPKMMHQEHVGILETLCNYSICMNSKLQTKIFWTDQLKDTLIIMYFERLFKYGDSSLFSFHLARKTRITR